MALTVLLAGCSGSRVSPCSPLTVASRTPLFELGQPYRATVGAGTLMRCPGVTYGFRAELVDENNVPVPDVEWAPVADSSRLLAELRFTPMRGGPYFYSVTFEPSVAVVQGVIALGVRRPRPVLETIPLPAATQCLGGFVTDRGSLFCRGNTRLTRVRPGEPPVEIPFGGVVSPIAFAGDTFWFGGVELKRWVDTDAGVVNEPAKGTQLMQRVLAATPTEAFAADFDVVSRYGVADGGWLPRETIPVAQTLSITAGDVLHSLAPARVAPDGGWWWWAGPDRWCQNPVIAGGGQRCFAAQGSSGFVEPERIWFQTAAGVGTLDEAGRAVTVAMPRNEPGVAPVLHDDGRIAYVALEPDGGLVVELIDGGYQTGWVQGDRLYLVSEDAVTVLPR